MIKDIKDSIKNFLTAILIVLVLYQTTELWFEDSWSHNFFYTFFSNQNSYDNTTKPFYIPYRIVISDGSKNYNVFYSHLDDKMKELSFDEIIKSITNLDYISEVDIKLDKILESKAVLLQYNFPVKTSFFLESAGKKNNDLITNVNEFSSFVVVPARGQAGQVKYYFLSGDKVYQFSAKQNKNFEKIYTYLGDQSKYGKLNYDISKNLQIMKDNIFIPRFTESFEYDVIKIKNPYRDSNGLDQIYDVEPKTDIFFENPSARIAKPGSFTNKLGQVQPYYVFSDLSQKVVYYYPGDQSYLEYHNYKVSNSKKVSLVDCYNIAVNFVNKDLKFLNDNQISFDYYLSKYVSDDKKTTFYFDYTINDFKIVLSENYDMKNHIEITVENETVTNYKKIALKYEVSKNKDYAKIAYQQVLDEQYFPIGDNSIYNISLGYKAEVNFDLDIYLNWYFDFNNSKSLSYPTKKAGD